MWTLRCLYELESWDSASFITLTYDDLHLPLNGSLKPSDLTKFFKRLRRNLELEYGTHTELDDFGEEKQIPNHKIKYYACGEYGDIGERPHFHAIVYGLDNYSDTDRNILKKTWTNSEPWLFDKERGKDSGMQEVTREDIQYVCGYVKKKLKGVAADKEYTQKSRIPPFSRISQGIGLAFFEKNKDRLLSNGWTYYNAQKVSIPRYFCEKAGVKKSELVNNQLNLNVEQIEKENNEIFKTFAKDMQRIGIDVNAEDRNLTMLAIRFERWYQDKNYQLSEQVLKDFNQRQKMRGSKL